MITNYPQLKAFIGEETNKLIVVSGMNVIKITPEATLFKEISKPFMKILLQNLVIYNSNLLSIDRFKLEQLLNK